MCYKWIKKLFTKQEMSDLPSLHIDKVIDELEYDIQIHESYAGLVVQNPSRYPPSVYGDYDWHMRWIKVYQNAIWFIRRAI